MVGAGINMCNSEPVLSVIVPIYNGSIYIDELFYQLENQNLRHVELVFVDDGSVDDSWDKLNAYVKHTKANIKVYWQKNQGVSAARNLGLEKARGKYVSFVDVDDAIVCNYFDVLLQYADTGIDVLAFASKRVTTSFDRLNRENALFSPARVLTKEQMLYLFLKDPKKWCVTSIMAKRSHLLKKRVISPVGYKYYEDYDMLLQLFAQTDHICVVDQILYYYLLREGSAMGHFTAERINCLQLIKHRCEWLKEVVPNVSQIFEKWGTSRLYWSVLWQAALALENYHDFLKFSKITHAKQYLKKLVGYPDLLLRTSTYAFLLFPPAYYFAVNLIGRKRSKVTTVRLEDIQVDLLDNIAFY